jgi:hypothetical protein
MDANFAAQSQRLALADNAYLELLPGPVIPHPHGSPSSPSAPGAGSTPSCKPPGRFLAALAPTTGQQAGGARGLGPGQYVAHLADAQAALPGRGSQRCDRLPRGWRCDPEVPHLCPGGVSHERDKG